MVCFQRIFRHFTKVHDKTSSTVVQTFLSVRTELDFKILRGLLAPLIEGAGKNAYATSKRQDPIQITNFSRVLRYCAQIFCFALLLQISIGAGLSQAQSVKNASNAAVNPAMQKSIKSVSKDVTAENIFSRNCEGPLTDGRGRLFVVNFEQDGTIGLVKTENVGTLGKIDAKLDAVRFATLPKGSVGNSLRMGKRGEIYIADFKAHNILLLDTLTKEIREYVRNERFNQPNDLCITSSGLLFASDPNWKDSTGKLWRIEPERGTEAGRLGLKGTAVLLDSALGTTNGITFSPDETVLYVNESIQRRIWAYTLDKQGNVSQKRLFVSFQDFGLDGMKCDNAGNLYVTRYGKGVIAIFSPKGVLQKEIPLKGKDCSNLTFGGKDGKTLFVTMQDRKCVEAVRVQVAGKQ